MWLDGPNRHVVAPPGASPLRFGVASGFGGVSDELTLHQASMGARHSQGTSRRESDRSRFLQRRFPVVDRPADLARVVHEYQGDVSRALSILV